MRHTTNIWRTAALGVLLTTACAGDKPKPADTPATAPSTVPATPSPAAPAWERDGVKFSGPPAGGRGGSYAYTLCPDGKYTRWCLDADCDRGTWRRDGDAVVLTSENPDTKGQETRLAVSADGETLGPPDVEGGPLKNSGKPEAGACGG
jgi:hypothetical protein